jgi:hypothetical protein
MSRRIVAMLPTTYGKFHILMIYFGFSATIELLWEKRFV